jgi:pimeloyl-ACP methyl ester carboxylesterase
VRTLARRRELEAWARRLTVPVLVIHGERDPLVPVRTATALAAAHPHWSLAVAPGAGHLPMLEVPEWTAASVAAWWQRVDPAR